MSKYLLALEVPETGVPPADRSIDGYLPTVGKNSGTLGDSLNTISGAGTDILNIMLYAAGIVLVVSVILHAISYITAGGDEGKAAQARKGLINSAAGIVIVTLTFVIVNAIAQFVERST